MNSDAVRKLHKRISRNFELLQTKAGQGYSEKYTQPDGNIVTHQITNIKSPEDLENELLNLFTQIWNMKDHLKKLGKTTANKKKIEDIINSDINLKIVGDISNSDKHGGLDTNYKPRTGMTPRLKNVGFRIPQKAIGSITFEPYKTSIDIQQPEEAIFRAEIGFTNGEPSKDAFDVLNNALYAWETQAFPLVGLKIPE